MVFLKQLFVDAGLKVKAFQVGGRGHFDEVFEAGAILSKERQVIGRFFAAGSVALEAAAGRDVGLVADDRIDAAIFGLFIELECAAEIAVIGERQGVHAVLFGARYQL